MKTIVTIFLILLLSTFYAQEEIEFRTDGIVLPRTATRSVDSPIKGMLIYDSESSEVKYYDGRQWLSMGGNASVSWNSITGKPSGFADNVDNTIDADASSTNELQNLSLSNDMLALSNSGQSVDLSIYKSHWLLDASLKNINFPIGNVGIHRNSTEALLDINGAIKLSTNSNTEVEGMIRYNSNTQDFEGFNGRNWLSLTGLPSPEPPPVTYSIGDYNFGGVIFWISPDTTQLKVVHLFELGTSVWSNVFSTLAGTNSGDGMMNSHLISQQTGHTSSGAKLCHDLTYEGHSDWYLPSINEITELLDQNSIVNPVIGSWFGDELNGAMWSSSETSNSQASYVNGAGVLFEAHKTTPWRIRAVRSVTIN